MDIISYNEFELETKLSKNPRLARYIAKLSDQYNQYKGIYDYPTRFKSTFWCTKIVCNIKILEFEYMSKLHYVKIIFDTPKYDKITKDRAAKFADMLSAIGGTMGLLTGFSIVSGVEIIYFIFKIALQHFKNCK